MNEQILTYKSWGEQASHFRPEPGLPNGRENATDAIRYDDLFSFLFASVFLFLPTPPPPPPSNSREGEKKTKKKPTTNLERRKKSHLACRAG